MVAQSLFATGICASLIWSFFANMSLGETGKLILCGLLAWTLLEYCLHRWGLHSDRLENPWIAGLSNWHRRHHREPRNPDYRYLPASVVIPYASLLFAGIALAMPSLISACLLSSGIALGFIAYETIHTLAHNDHPHSRLGRALRRYHLIHHYASPRRAFGITSPFWDVIFATRPNRRAPLAAVSDTKNR